MSPIDALVNWLIDGAPGAADSAAVVTRIAEALQATPFEVARVAAYVTTLHPTIAGRSFRWTRQTGTVVAEAPHGLFESDDFKNSPVRDAFATKKEVRIRLVAGAARSYPVVDQLLGEGCTDYIVVPMIFTTGETHAISFATKQADGFSDGALEAIRTVCRPLARLAEILALRRVATTLLSTYVGRNSGERILGGRIRRGDFETVRAAIWFSDLRGFTELSSRGSTREVIDTLNAIFDCQVPSIEEHGGEVLKFMGDGLLAIFPFAEGEDPRKTVDSAIDAADEAVAAVAALAPLRIGLALHVGELAYGNIGGAHRLDFTAVGPAVNLTSRLEGLTSKLGRPLVVSEGLARITSCETEDVGTFELKGIPAPVRVFAPRPRS